MSITTSMEKGEPKFLGKHEVEHGILSILLALGTFAQ